MLETRYTINGEEILIHQYLNDGFIVSNVYENGPTGNQYYLPSDSVFATPPVKKLHEEILKLNDSIQMLKNEKISYVSDIKDQQSKLNEILNDIKKYDAVQPIFDFAKGEITHFVDIGNFKILDLHSIEYDNGHLKMIGLTGKKDRLLEWRIYNYSDGSGSSLPVIPCKSKEEATEILAKIANKALIQNSSDYTRNRVATSSLEYGYDIPGSVIKEYHNAQKENILKRIKEEQVRLENTQKNIEKWNALLEATPS